METALCLAIWFLTGLWCYNIMKRKNRNTSVGIALGVLFGLIGVIICYCIPSKKLEETNS